MYGWINASLESLVIHRFGPDTWIQILREAGCHAKIGDFIRNVDYPDDLTKRLIDGGAKVLNITSEDMVELLGRNFVRFVRQCGYETTIRCQGSTFAEWLKNLNEPHRLLRSRFPNSKFPEFWCFRDESDTTGNTLILHYYSYRSTLFCPMVIGVVKEAGKEYYHVDVTMESMFQTINGAVCHAAWRVTWKDVPVSPMAITDLHALPIASPAKRSKFSHRLANQSSSTTASSDSAEKSNVDMTTDKCPFAAAFASRAALHPSNIRPPQPTTDDVEMVVEKSCSLESTNDAIPSSSVNNCQNHNATIGLNPQRLKEAFPFHIAVSVDFKVIQIGPKLAQLIFDSHVAGTCLNVHIGNFFTISTPPDFPWDWNMLKNLEDSTIEVTLNHTKKKICFRGTMMFLDPTTDTCVTGPSCLFLLNPHIFNLNDINELNLKLSDFPSHNFQRDLLIIGEHLKSEASSAVALDVLSKKLDEESRISQNALKTKRVFVRYVSHEIRTPLNITILGLKYLEDELKKENKEALFAIQDVLDDVKCSCTIAVDILNDLLLYEKLDDGIFTLSLSVISMCDFFREAINVFKVQAKSSDIDLTVSTKGLDGVMVKIDRTKFSQVLRNIVSNALKFTPRNGKVSVSCHTLCSTTNDHGVVFAESSIPNNTTDTVSAPSQEVNRHVFNPEECIRIDSGFVRINVTDTGPGISKEDQHHLFHEFTQFKADKLQNGQGSGLGLWIASNIVALHGGRIGILSEGEGKGSTFIVDIPINHKSNQSSNNSSLSLLREEPSAEATSTLDAVEALKRRRILIVDDASTNRKICRRMLQNKFNVIDEAENGQEAVDKYLHALEEDNPYAVIMMDYQMPIMNGLDATKIIKSFDNPPIVVGVTGNGLQGDIDVFMEAGADTVMIKPINIDEFVTYVSKH